MKAEDKKQHEVHIFTQKTCMKFIPKNFEKPVKKIQAAATTSKISSKITSRFSISSLFRSRSSLSSEIAQQEQQKSQQSQVENGKQDNEGLPAVAEAVIQQQNTNYKLKFATKIGSEHFLIGNQYQLDVIGILGVNPSNYVETQYIYSFQFKEPIKHVSVDQKKLNLLAIVTGKTLHIYKYDMKKIMEQNIPAISSLALTEDVKFMQIAKDGNICLFYEQFVQVYLVSEQIRKRYSNKYKKPEFLDQEKYIYRIFMVPEPFDNIINVFFQQRTSEQSKLFTLWAVQFQFLSSEIKTSAPKKVYEVKSSFQSNLSIKNFSKQLFLMNLGGQILALKKGYILDSATVNLKHESSFLEYIGNETLLHVTPKKVEVYSFKINTNIKPFRIVIKSKDSIKICAISPEDEFFKVLNIANDYLVIFQKGTKNSKSKLGEIHYSFYLTRATTRQVKMNQLFPKGMTIDKVDDPVLLDKCDMAEKMGFTIRQVYLQLWSRSNQSKNEDFQILIATKDYHTIKQETMKKLKKSSMKLTDIKQIQQYAFKMLNSRVFSTSCTEDVVMDYISSHFFNRKIKMFEKTLALEKAERQKATGVIETDFKYKMTIRQYQQYRSMEIKTELISLVNQFCHEGKMSSANHIRLLLQHFKFVFRTIYYELLDQIVKNSKEKLLDLLNEIPQLLPYSPPTDREEIEPGLYEGVWPEINRSQWNQSLYIDAITTIDNKQIILEQVITTVNFKRNWLSQHDMVLWSVQKIKANQSKIKSQLTFYFFIAKMFSYVRDEEILVRIVDFLEKTYKLPENIKGNVFLMEKMYKFFVDKNIVPELEGRPLRLDEFLAFQDKQYIRHCFEKQRSNKGLLLKDLKDIFKQVLKQQANEKYNNAILNYFTSDLSQVSDLKYILNRINNQKVEFHQENQQMYEILVLALQKKLKIGTQDDIPIEQVLIYIENIPLKFNTEPSKSLSELKAVQKIESSSQILRMAKVNMSIYDILNNPQQVFNKIIHYYIDTAPPEVWEDFSAFETFAIQKISQIQIFSEEIYGESNEKDIFFILLTNLCQKIERIKFADYLIKNEHFSEKLDTVEGLVLFMKKWKLSNEKQYFKNQQYIKELLTLLPSDSDFFTFIQSQLQFAKILSAPQYPVTYPISQIYITAADIRDIIFQLPVSFVLKIPIRHLFQMVEKMQDILISQQNDSGGEEFLTVANRVTLHQTYEFVLMKLINENKLREVLPLIRQLIQLDISNPTYNIVYLIVFAINISNEFNENIKNNIFLCIWYFFYHPFSLLEMFEYLLNNPLSSRQIKMYVDECVEKGKQKSKGYNEKNPIFDEDYLKMIKGKEDEINFMLTLQKTSRHIQQSKQQFKHVKYTAIMIMLCNSPYALAKYISCSYSYDLHVKSIRSFLSYAIQEKVFKPFAILEFGKRVFLTILEASKNRYPIEVVIEKYQDQYSIDQQVEIQGYEPPKEKKNYQYLMWKSADAFKKKKLALQTQKILKANSPAQSALQKSERLRSQLDKVPNLDERDPFEYPFTEIDSDNNDANNQAELQDNKKKKKEIPKFDASQQMKIAMKAEGKSHKLFLSTRGEIRDRNTSNNLMVSIRQPYKTTQNPIQESSQQVKKLGIHKFEERNNFKQGLEHRESQDFEEIQRQIQGCKTQRGDQKLRPSQSAIDYQPRHSADSSPEILINKFSDRITPGIELQKSQQIIGDDEQVNISSHGDSGQRMEENQEQPCYNIKIKEVFDADEILEMNKNIPQKIDFENGTPEIMVESTEFENPIHNITQTLIDANRAVIDSPFPQYNFQCLKQYDGNKQMMIDIAKNLYREHQHSALLPKIMKMIGQIILSFPIIGIDSEKFGIILKAQQAQTKTIPEIKFRQLLPEAAIFAEYNSKRDIFQKLYSRLSKFIDSQNIYKITQFVRRVFDNPEFQQQVTWDFILDQADKLQICEQEDRTWALQKIQANLPKVDMSIWNRNISNFQIKVLSSSEKESLLKIFCDFLRDKKGNYEAITFLETVKQLDNSQIISQTLLRIQEG